MPCCMYEVDNIFSFLNVAKVPLVIFTNLLPSNDCATSDCSASLLTRVTSTNRFAGTASGDPPTNITDGFGFNTLIIHGQQFIQYYNKISIRSSNG